MREIWTLLSRSSAVDRDSNAVSVFEIVEELRIGQLPPNAPRPLNVAFPMTLTTLWERDEGDPQIVPVRFEIFDPEGTNLTVPPTPAELNFGDFMRLRSRTNIPGWPVTSAGLYLVRVSISIVGDDRWEVMSEISLPVVLG